MTYEKEQIRIDREKAGLVLCDDPLCPAVIDPRTNDELFDALEHWQGHNYLSGCSHGQ